MHAHDDAPSPWVERFAPLVPPGACVLDVAAGTGRHARLFAARGARVLAVDRDAAALARLAGTPGVTCRVVDLEGPAWLLDGDTFDAIVVTNYLHRPRLPDVRAALRPHGVLLYETFADGNAQFGRPTNPDFLLHRDELLDFVRAASDLTVVAFEQGWVRDGAREAVVQRIAAVGAACPWPPALA